MLVGVSIMAAPPFPGDEALPLRGTPAVVVAACAHYPDKGGWWFIALENVAKQLIAGLLIDGGAEMGRWYWLDIHRGPAADEGEGGR